MVAVLSGGVGGAKLVLGLTHVLAGEAMMVITNTADDFRHLGLYIAPDTDTVVYTLADIADKERGWGRAGETWSFMGALRALGGETWFNLGDGDLAMHVERSRRLAAGETLTQATAALSRALGIRVAVLPMSDDPVATVVETADGPLAFQHYFVRERCEPRVTGFRFDGIDRAQPNPTFMESLAAGRITAMVIAPSNPFVSIDPILALSGLRNALLAMPGPRVAISPIVGGQAIKGPAARMMEDLGMPVTAAEVARHYAGLVDAMVIDHADREQERAIRDLGMDVLVTKTVMQSLDDRKALARDCLALIEAMRAR